MTPEEDFPYTFREIGEHLGVTKNRIKQICDRALCKLRRPEFSRVFRLYFDEIEEPDAWLFAVGCRQTRRRVEIDRSDDPEEDDRDRG